MSIASCPLVVVLFCNDMQAIQDQVDQLTEKLSYGIKVAVPDPASLEILLLDLYQCSRELTFNSRSRKAEIADSKALIDRLDLELGNINYQKSHLNREIEKCLAYEQNYDDMEMHSLAELQDCAPDLLDTMDIHQQMIKRLQYELDERIRMAESNAQLKADKAKMILSIKELEKNLANIDSTVESFSKNADTVGISLGLTEVKSRDMLASANLLPNPIFILCKIAYGYYSIHGNITFS